jgi:hypothetical protein
VASVGATIVRSEEMVGKVHYENLEAILGSFCRYLDVFIMKRDIVAL